MIHDDRYTTEVLASEGGVLLGRVSFPEYPILFLRRSDMLIALEGRIYNHPKPVFEASLCELGFRICHDPASASERVREWILGHDGEYVCAIVSPDRRRVWMFCDAMGRLPLYYHVTEKGLWLARECKFILSSRDDNDFDPIGWAQYMWMGYPFGNRTLFSNVAYAPPAMLISTERLGEKLRTRIEQLFEFNFDEKDNSQYSVMKWGQDLAEQFVGVTRDRASTTSMNVISLSGGHDSRAVAAAMPRVGVSCVAATFEGADGTGKDDACIAERIAQELRIPWELTHTPAQTASDEIRLVRMKDGLNYAAMAFILPFMEAIVAKWGRAAYYITGDGGDKVLPDLVPHWEIKSLPQLRRAILRLHAPYASIELVEKIMGLRPGTLMESLSQVIERYPEANFNHRVVHFSFSERARRWLFEGEDRARFFLWQTSPFFSFEFCRSAMRVPDHLKKFNRLYRHFQIRLSSAVSHIPDPAIGVGIDSRWYQIAQRRRLMRRDFPVVLKKQLRQWMKRESKLCIGDITHVSEWGMAMSAPHLDKFLRAAEPREVYVWTTLERLHALWSDPASSCRYPS